MAQPGQINIGDITQETRDALGLDIEPSLGQAGNRHLSLGRVLKALDKLPDNDALWVLKQARRYFYQGGNLVAEEESEEYMPPISWVLQVVANCFQIKPSDMKQRQRLAEVVVARQVAMYILWQSERYTLAEIGESLGGRSPATVSHGYQRIASQLPNNKILVSKIKEIEEEF